VVAASDEGLQPGRGGRVALRHADLVARQRHDGGPLGADDVVWAPLPSSGLAVVLGRQGTPYRARERRQLAALARIADTRLRELRRSRSRRAHPSMG
jgi:hypothetical protein